MARDDGFRTADVGVGLLADPKVAALARCLRDPERTAAAVLLFVATILGSWSAGRRLTAGEAVPLWWLDPTPDLIDALTDAGLLDADGRIPAAAWDTWYGAAAERRERSREKWRDDKRRARQDAPEPDVHGGQSRTNDPDLAMSTDSRARAVPVPVPVPVPDSVTESGSGTAPGAADGAAWSTFGPEWNPFREAWGHRFSRPPNPKQRAVLWGEDEGRGAIQDWPDACGAWAAEAPSGATPFEVVGYILERYHEKLGGGPVIADRPTLAILARVAAAKTPAELAEVQPDAYLVDVTWQAWCRRSEALAGRAAGQPDLAAEARRHAIALASTAMGRPVSAREAAAWTFGRDARLGPDRRPR